MDCTQSMGCKQLDTTERLALHCTTNMNPSLKHLPSSTDPIKWVVCVGSVLSVVSDSLQPYGLQLSRFLCPWDSPGKNIGVSCHFLLQGILPIQGLNPRLMSPALAGEVFTTNASWEAWIKGYGIHQSLIFTGLLTFFRIKENTQAYKERGT